jgi:hypothetical protein
MSEFMLQKVGAELRPALAFFRRGFGAAQRGAVLAFAASCGFEIVGELSAAFETGGAPALTLSNLTELLVRIDINSARAVIVSSANLFSATPVERIVGYEKLRERGIDLVAADEPEAFAAESEAHPEIRKILAESAQFDAATNGAASRLNKGTRRASTGRPHRKTYAELAPDATFMAKRLYQASRTSGERITLREISAKLCESGFVGANEKPYHPEVIRRMLNGHWPRTKTA